MNTKTNSVELAYQQARKAFKTLQLSDIRKKLAECGLTHAEIEEISSMIIKYGC